MSKDVLAIREVAEYFKVTEKTVYSLAQRRKLPGFKVGGQWRFKRQDIHRWIEKQKSTTCSKVGTVTRRTPAGIEGVRRG